MLHTDGLCGVLGFTAPLILISKKFKSKYIYTLNSALRTPLARAAVKYTPRLIIFWLIFWTPFIALFCKWKHFINTVTFHQTMQNEYSKFLSFCHFCKVPYKLGSRLPFGVVSQLAKKENKKPCLHVHKKTTTKLFKGSNPSWGKWKSIIFHICILPIIFYKLALPK